MKFNEIFCESETSITKRNDRIHLLVKIVVNTINNIQYNRNNNFRRI